MRRFLRSSAHSSGGFNLIEVMVATAITATIAAISIPQYQKFVAKSRQGEAKIGLSGLYAAQKAFGVEFRSYTACLRTLGHTASDVRYYAYGFRNDSHPGYNCGLDDGQTQANKNCLGMEWNSQGGIGGLCSQTNDLGWPATHSAGGENENVATLTNLSGGPGDITRNTFIFRAAGNISNSRSEFDRWRIDEDKVIYQEASGV